MIVERGHSPVSHYVSSVSEWGKWLILSCIPHQPPAMGGVSIYEHKRSIRYEPEDATGRSFHFYEELFGPENVYLELEGFHFEAASVPDITFDKSRPRLVVQLRLNGPKLGLMNGKTSASGTL